MKKKCILALSIFLAAFFSVGSMPVSGTEAPQEQTPTIISTDAGKNGYYSYDVRTEEQTYTPVSAYAGRSAGRTMLPPAPSAADIEAMAENDGFPDELNVEDLPEDIQEQLKLPTPRDVIGVDSRVKVSNLAPYHYASTCLVLARYKDEYKTYATGFLINSNYLATAAHLLYNANHEGWAKHFAVYAGASGGSYKKYTLGYWYDAGGDFIANADNPNYAYGERMMYDDWGVVRLATPITECGHLGLMVANQASDFNGKLLTTQGYPLDRNSPTWGSGPNDYQNYNMYHTSGYITGNMPGPQRYLPVVTADLDVTEGQSGSPVYQYHNGEYYARGIVVAGHPAGNRILLINQWLFDFFVSIS